MIVRLFNFSKKARSTKRPTIPPDTDPTNLYEGITVDPMDILNPVLKFDLGAPNNAPTFNYAYIKELGQRLYFITNWTFDNGYWYASMECDVLGTWKTEIGSTTQYVTRSSYTYDDYLVDQNIKAKAGVKLNSNSVFTFNEMSYYWSSFGDPDDDVNLNRVMLLNVNKYSEHNPASDWVENKSLIIIRCNGKTSDFIISEICRQYGTNYIDKIVIGNFYCPVVPRTLHNRVFHFEGAGISRADEIFAAEIHLTGNYEAYREEEDNYYMNFTMTADIPTRAASIVNSKWTYVAGRELFISGQPFGRIKIPSELFINATKIILSFNLEIISGRTEIKIGSDILGMPLINFTTVNLYSEVPIVKAGIGDIYQRIMAYVGFGVSTAAAAAAGGFTAAAAMGVINANAKTAAADSFAKMMTQAAQQNRRSPDIKTIVSGYSAFEDFYQHRAYPQKKATILGAAGLATNNIGQAVNNLGSIISSPKSSMVQNLGTSSLTIGIMKPYLSVEDTEYTDYPLNECGRPLCQYKTISAIPGFIQCESPIFSIRSNMLPIETSSILESMSNGFFYE